jgi:2-methylisocitrate lyase-like PEP mutase family enzyme
MPNVWDVGSARLFESLGFEAIATTSSGLAASLGRHDQSVSLDELVQHVAALSRSVAIPVSVDAEDGYADDGPGLARTIEVLAAAGASGVSIEDHRRGRGLLGLEEAARRVESYVRVADAHDMTVTARAENHLYGEGDLGDTIRRLQAYAAVGADVVYAPGLDNVTDIERVVSEIDRPVNVLLVPRGPHVSQLREAGVRRISTGGALAFVAYGAAARAGRELLREGTTSYSEGALSPEDRESAFGPG